MQFAGGNGLQFSEQNVRVGIAAGNEHCPARQSPGRGRRYEPPVRSTIDCASVEIIPLEIHHRGQRDDRHNCDDRVFKLENRFDKCFQHPACDAP